MFLDVFERKDVNKTLIHCKKILKRDGQILINIPDYGNIARKFSVLNGHFLNVHLYYFNKKTPSFLTNMVLNMKKVYYTFKFFN